MAGEGGGKRLRTTVTVPSDLVEAVERYLSRHPEAKFHHALVELARLGAAEHERRDETRRIAELRQRAVDAKRWAPPDTEEMLSPDEAWQAILDSYEE